jgi:hypothetical protein
MFVVSKQCFLKGGDNFLDLLRCFDVESDPLSNLFLVCCALSQRVRVGMPPSIVKRTPFSVASSSSSFPPQLGVMAQAALPDGQEVIRVVQHDTSKLPNAVQPNSGRPAVQRTAVQLTIPGELYSREKHGRDSIEADAASALEVLAYLNSFMCSSNMQRSVLSQKRRRLDVASASRINDTSRHRVEKMMQRWEAAALLPINDDAPVFTFPLKACFDNKSLFSACEKYLSRGVDGCGDTLAKLATDPHGNAELSMQSILAQLRFRGADCEILRCVECILEDQRFGSLQGAVPFLHALFLASVALVGCWFQSEQRAGIDARATVGSALWCALRLLQTTSSRIPFGSVRVEDSLIVYKALSTIYNRREDFERIVGEDSLAKLEKLLQSTLSHRIVAA